MDLIRFDASDPSVRLLRDSQPNAPLPAGAKTKFIPLGKSVVPYTERLFSARRPERGLLSGLVSDPDSMDSHFSFDPGDFERLTHSTIVALEKLSNHSATDQNPALAAALERARPVLETLQADRDALQNAMTALERI